MGVFLPFFLWFLYVFSPLSRQAFVVLSFAKKFFEKISIIFRLLLK